MKLIDVLHVALKCILVYVTCRTHISNKLKHTPTSLYECTHLKYQGKSAQILLCGDFSTNARTAGGPDFLRMAELQPLLSTALDEDELPDHIRQRCNQDLLASDPRHWVLSYWGSANWLISSTLILLIRQWQDPGGRVWAVHSCQSAQGCCSTIDYFVAFAQCFSAVKWLIRLFIAQITILCFCTLLTKRLVTHTDTSSAAPVARSRYDVQKAEHIKRVLQLSCSTIPFHSISKSLMLLSCDNCLMCTHELCSQNTLLQACKRGGVHSCNHMMHQPWFYSNDSDHCHC